MALSPDGSYLSHRHLRTLLVLLVLSNLSLGAISIFLIGRTTQDYSTLIKRSVPVFYESRTMGQADGLVFRSVLTAVISDDPAICAAARERVTHQVATARSIRAHLVTQELFRQHPDLAARYEATAEAFETAALDLAQRVTPQTTAESVRPALFHLQQLYETHVQSLEQASKMIMGYTEAENTAFNEATRTRSEWFAALAGWPLVVVIVLGVLAVAVLVLMLTVWRQTAISDEP